MIKIILLLTLSFFSVSVLADQRMRPDGMGGWVVEDTSGCGGLIGSAKGTCMAYQQQMQMKKANRQDEIQQQQIENLRLQNELLRRQMKNQ